MSMQTVCITGASGFVGAYLVPLFLSKGVNVRVLSRSDLVAEPKVQCFLGSFFDEASLIPFLQDADLLINLAHPSELLSDEQFGAGIRNLARAARAAGVRRVLHISTAMVVGIPREKRVTEECLPRPKTVYERQKFAAEKILNFELATGVDFGILRPTAVFGYGGQNLQKLADGISKGSTFKRRVLRFLHGKRNMHLVSITDVVNAIVFLAFSPRPLEGNVFLIAGDDQPANNYQTVDAIIGAALGKPVNGPSCSVPGFILCALLRLAGRSQADPKLIYDASKIRSWGFQPKGDFTSELEMFARAYMKSSDR